MGIDKAKAILERIQKTGLTVLRDGLLKSAIRYARIRADWYLSELEEKREMDTSRSRAHDAFIDSCNILSRNMKKNGEDITWRMELGEDRKEIGDFACYLHCILGLKAR